MFTLRYEYGNDRINGSWNNIGAFVNVGFQMENIIKGESPFTAPEPIFKSPRNLRRMLTQKVKRDWNQQYAPGRVRVASASSAGGCSLGSDVVGEVRVGTPNDLVPEVSWSELTEVLYVTVQFTYSGGDGHNLQVMVACSENPVTNVYHTKPIWGDGTVTWQLCGAQAEFTSPKNPNQVIFNGVRGLTIT